MITIQNHGGYYFEDYTPDTYTTVFDEYNNRCYNTFMTLTNESDKALEMLFTELKQRDEKYVVLVFGDHQPELALTDSSDFMAGGRAWVVPYIIWANYDIAPEQLDSLRPKGGLSSLNFLASDVLRAAGFELNSYFALIDSVRDEVPSISSSGYILKDGNVISAESGLPDGTAGERMRYYRYLQYNILFDDNNSSLFKNYVYN